jgi:phosphopantothenoylcysteine decarboxylase/phosphopantothenate--cysteine ligase
MKFLISAGPTREFIDPVRFLSNRSTGKMGYAIAAAAAGRGHETVLVSGPVSITPPESVRIINIVSALDMLSAIKSELEECDALVMCAAVADWRPKKCSELKLKKRSMSSILELVPNPDILSEIKQFKGERIFVGFAAETDNLEEEAQEKLSRKGLDLIVANDVTQPGAGFEVETNIATMISADLPPEHLPLMTKKLLAEKIIARVETLAESRIRAK